MIRIKEIDLSQIVKTNPTLCDEIKSLLEVWRFEFSTPTNRQELCKKISDYIGRDVMDRTTHDMVDKQEFCFVINCCGKEYPLLEYARNSILLDRKDKLMKIKQKYENR